MLNAGTIVDGNLQILHKIGEGGNGEVYAARQLDLERVVAFKLCAPKEGGSDADKRFEQEATILSRLRHPNIVPVYKFGYLGDNPYFITELVKGSSLDVVYREKINGVRIYDERLLVQWIIQVCEALQKAHSVGIIHRDLKPANILIDDQNRARVIDFGLAKMLHPTSEQMMTAAQTVVGTVGYMSPEQCVGKQLGPESDLYSVGCILYEGLTGRLLFGNSEPIIAMYKHVHQPPPTLEPTDTALYGEFQPLLDRLLAKDTSARFASARQVVEELECLRFDPSHRSRPLPNVPTFSTALMPAGVLAVISLILFGLIQLFTSGTHGAEESVTRLQSFDEYQNVPALNYTANVRAPDRLLREGSKHLGQRRFEESIAAFRKSLEQTPVSDVQSRIMIYLSLAEALSKIGSTEALDICKKALVECENKYGTNSPHVLPILELLAKLEQSPNQANSELSGIRSRLTALAAMESSASDVSLFRIKLRSLRDNAQSQQATAAAVGAIAKQLRDQPLLAADLTVDDLLVETFTDPTARKQLLSTVRLADARRGPRYFHEDFTRLLGLHYLSARLGDEGFTAQSLLAMQNMRRDPGVKFDEKVAYVYQQIPQITIRSRTLQQALLKAILATRPANGVGEEARLNLGELLATYGSDPAQKSSGVRMMLDVLHEEAANPDGSEEQLLQTCSRLTALEPKDRLHLEKNELHAALRVVARRSFQGPTVVHHLGHCALNIAPYDLSTAKEIEQRCLQYLPMVSSAGFSERDSAPWTIVAAALAVSKAQINAGDVSGALETLDLSLDAVKKNFPECMHGGNAVGASDLSVLMLNRLILKCICDKAVASDFAEISRYMLVDRVTSIDINAGPKLQKIDRCLLSHQRELGPNALAAIYGSVIVSQFYSTIPPELYTGFVEHGFNFASHNSKSGKLFESVLLWALARKMYYDKHSQECLEILDKCEPNLFSEPNLYRGCLLFRASAEMRLKRWPELEQAGQKMQALLEDDGNAGDLFVANASMAFADWKMGDYATANSRFQAATEGWSWLPPGSLEEPFSLFPLWLDEFKKDQRRRKAS